MFITSYRRLSSAEHSTDALSLTDQAPSNFLPERFPILARHWFGVEPLRPIGSIIFPVVQRFESLQEASHASE